MKIVHLFRAPVGGLFRHVVDLAYGQIARGHQVGLILDSLTGDTRSNAVLGKLQPELGLGITRVAMRRQPGPMDAGSLFRIARALQKSGVDIIHGHGAKGGALARLVPARHAVVRAYTPHGGSLHDSIGGKLHLLIERLLNARGNLYLFESAYSRDAFVAKVGTPHGISCVVHNGLGRAEFDPIANDPEATDVVFLGEMRALKGVDVLIDAIAILHGGGRTLTATLVGDGPDLEAFQRQVLQLGLAQSIRFRPPMAARAAFALGRVLAVPSRAESLPYVVLEAAAAARPMVATRVGGIPEIFGPLADQLVPPGSPQKLAEALSRALDAAAAAMQTAQTLRTHIGSAFSMDAMVEHILGAYQEAGEWARRAERLPLMKGQGSHA